MFLRNVLTSNITKDITILPGLESWMFLRCIWLLVPSSSSSSSSGDKRRASLPNSLPFILLKHGNLIQFIDWSMCHTVLYGLEHWSWSSRFLLENTEQQRFWQKLSINQQLVVSFFSQTSSFLLWDDLREDQRREEGCKTREIKHKGRKTEEKR